MKKIILLILAFSCLIGCSGPPQEYMLQHKDSGKEIVLGNVITPKDFQLLMGKAQHIEREPDSDGEGAPPWTLLTYKGMKVEFCGEFITEITITDKAWQINGIGIGSSLNEVKEQYKYTGKTYTGDADLFIFKENPIDDLLYTKSDTEGIITGLGFSSPCT